MTSMMDLCPIFWYLLSNSGSPGALRPARLRGAATGVRAQCSATINSASTGHGSAAGREIHTAQHSAGPSTAPGIADGAPSAGDASAAGLARRVPSRGARAWHSSGARACACARAAAGAARRASGARQGGVARASSSARGRGGWHAGARRVTWAGAGCSKSRRMGETPTAFYDHKACSTWAALPCGAIGVLPGALH